MSIQFKLNFKIKSLQCLFLEVYAHNSKRVTQLPTKTPLFIYIRAELNRAKSKDKHILENVEQKYNLNKAKTNLSQS